MGQAFYGTGKRKTSVARVWLKPGKGAIIINDKEIKEYFGRETCTMIAKQPLELLGVDKKYDITVNVCGGGITGQAGAIRHGITKALLELNPESRDLLKKAGFITRDSRAKERKKYGRRSARARFQYSKR